MTMFDNINTRLTTTKVRVQLATHTGATASAEDVQPRSSRVRPTSASFSPQDAFHGMEDQVNARIAYCLS